MITIICGTNRPSNETQKFVSTYKNLLLSKNQEVKELFLEKIPKDFAFNNSIYNEDSPVLDEIINNYIEPASKIVVISPEYNGSFPGILKAFIDCVPPILFKEKAIALVGIGAGLGGNLRGNDHLTGIFNYLKAFVIPIKVQISKIWSVTDEYGVLNDDKTIEALEEQIDLLIRFNIN